MITIKLHANYRPVLAFDGAVLEIFLDKRMHVSQIENIQVLTDKHGRHWLRIDVPGGIGDMEVDENALPKVTQVIAEVLKAKAEFRYD